MQVLQSRGEDMDEQNEALKKYLYENFPVHEIQAEDLFSHQGELEKANAAYSYLNEAGVAAEEISLEILALDRTQKTEKYFREEFGYINIMAPVGEGAETQPENIVIFLEKSFPYFSVTSSLLFVELNVMRGIAAKDIQERSTKYLEYRSHVEFLKEYRERLKELNLE